MMLTLPPAVSDHWLNPPRAPLVSCTRSSAQSSRPGLWPRDPRRQGHRPPFGLIGKSATLHERADQPQQILALGGVGAPAQERPALEMGYERSNLISMFKRGEVSGAAVARELHIALRRRRPDAPDGAPRVRRMAVEASLIRDRPFRPGKPEAIGLRGRGVARAGARE